MVMVNLMFDSIASCIYIKSKIMNASMQVRMQNIIYADAAGFHSPH